MSAAREGVFERDSHVVDYWLAHSEGFKLGKASSGRRVTRVVCDQRTGRARTLFVESWRRKQHVLPARAVAAVDPFNKVLYLAPRESVLRVSPFTRIAVRSGMVAARRSRALAAAGLRTGGRYGRDGAVWLLPRLRAAAWTTALVARQRYAEAALWLGPRFAAGLRATVAYADALVEAVRAAARARRR